MTYTSLPAPSPARWWHIPELAGLICAPAFMALAYVLSFISGPPVMGQLGFLMVAGLLGIGVIRASSYQTPDVRHRVFIGLYHGLYFGLFMAALQIAPDDSVLKFTSYAVLSGGCFGLFMGLFTRPHSARYDWTQVYLDQPLESFAAKQALIWPGVVVGVTFGVLMFSRSPAWAIGAGASALAFTPWAFPRNLLTARPSLLILLNVLAVCSILIAAASLILKGH